MALTPLQRNAAFRDLCAKFRETLLSATAERHQRDRFTAGDDGFPELAWVRYEREQMHAAVNARRAARGLPPVPVEAVRRVERQAEGHSDYVAQFAYGCARLVQGED